jgi:hypothetical protein
VTNQLNVFHTYLTSLLGFVLGPQLRQGETYFLPTAQWTNGQLALYNAFTGNLFNLYQQQSIIFMSCAHVHPTSSAYLCDFFSTHEAMCNGIYRLIAHLDA